MTTYSVPLPSATPCSGTPLEIDDAEHGAVLRVDHGRVLRRMAEDVDVVVEGVAVETVARRCARRARSIFLISFSVFVSNIEIAGWLVAKPCPDFEHTVAPLPPVSGISPTSVERVEVEHRDSRQRPAAIAGAVSVAGRASRGVARDVQPASGGVGEDVVRAAFAADLGRLEHFVRASRPGPAWPIRWTCRE